MYQFPKLLVILWVIFSSGLSSRSPVVFLLVLLLMGCQPKKEVEYRLASIVSFELDGSINKFDEPHLICFRCEVGRFPTTVKEIIDFQPKGEMCASFFEEPIAFYNPDLGSYSITTKYGELDTVIFYFTKEGERYSESIPISLDKFRCGE